MMGAEDEWDEEDETLLSKALFDAAAGRKDKMLQAFRKWTAKFPSHDVSKEWEDPGDPAVSESKQDSPAASESTQNSPEPDIVDVDELLLSACELRQLDQGNSAGGGGDVAEDGDGGGGGGGSGSGDGGGSGCGNTVFLPMRTAFCL